MYIKSITFPKSMLFYFFFFHSIKFNFYRLPRQIQHFSWQGFFKKWFIVVSSLELKENDWPKVIPYGFVPKAFIEFMDP